MTSVSGRDRRPSTEYEPSVRRVVAKEWCTSIIIDGVENSSATRRDVVRESYSARSQEYTDLFGSMDSTHVSDRALVTSWAATLTGPVLDAGCGPGQWTDFLAQAGLAVSGIDLVPEFVERARNQ